MTQEDKKLLLIDLCSRLPYDPFVKIGNNPNQFKISQRIRWIWSYGRVEHIFDDVKPYLRPMSSMTDEEREEFRSLGGVISHSPEPDHWAIAAFAPEAYDYLNSHHFDYRGLIEKGLALEAPEGMYSIK